MKISMTLIWVELSCVDLKDFKVHLQNLKFWGSKFEISLCEATK